MPFSNVPKSLTGKMDRCVQSVMKSGKSKKSAIAICYKQVVGSAVRDEASRRSRKGGK